jgi:hypothetical protein
LPLWNQDPNDAVLQETVRFHNFGQGIVTVSEYSGPGWAKKENDRMQASRERRGRSAVPEGGMVREEGLRPQDEGAGWGGDYYTYSARI